VKRLAILLLLALPLFADLRETYDRGVAAVRAGKHAAGAADLQRAIGEQPNESGALRIGNQIITYVPHFWLGIAKYNLDDYDGALRELKTSEDQGVVQSTQYYAQLKEWVARTNQEKKRQAESSAAESRKAADAAIAKALSGQMEAVAAGGDRSEPYRSAQRKLQEALTQFNAAGTNIAAYHRAADTAGQARELFSAAADEAKKAKAARAAAPPPVQQKPQPKAVEITATVPFDDKPKAQPVQPPVVAVTTQPPSPPVESEVLVQTRVALQNYKRRLIESHARPALIQEAQRLERRLGGKIADGEIRRIGEQVAARERELAKPVVVPQVVDVPAQTATVAPTQQQTDTRSELQLAYRAFANGDFAAADAMLSKLIAAKPDAQAYVLRGCARYTRAVLARQPLDGAAADFRAALELDRALTLDGNACSPKLVAYCDSMR
jgi:hypothetical protein